MSNIKISIITASRNSISTIGDSLNSIKVQTYRNIELINIDCASKDGTKEFIQSTYVQNSGVFISENDEGIYDALNKGLSLATGDIVGFLHSDDMLADKEVLSKVAFVFNNQSVDVVYGDLIYVKKDDPTKIVRYWKSSKFETKNLKNGWMPPHPALFFRKSVYELVGKFNLNYQISSDYDYILRIFLVPEIKSVYLPTILVKMRVGGVSNKSIRSIMRKSIEDLKIIKKNKVGGLITLFKKNIYKIKQFVNK